MIRYSRYSSIALKAWSRLWPALASGELLEGVEEGLSVCGIDRAELGDQLGLDLSAAFLLLTEMLR